MNRLKLILVLFLFNLSVFAQTTAKTDSLNNVLTFDKLLIPELDECIQSALKNSPLMKVNDQQIESLLEEIKIKKKSWLDYLQIDANTRYGLFNQLTLTESTGSTSPDIAIQQAKTQLNYFAGLSIKLPLSYFVNNKSEQKILKNSIKETELKKQDLKNEISKLVVIEYFKLKNFTDLLDAQQNNLQTTQIDYLKAKKDVQNGMLGITEFASISTSYTKAIEAFMKTKNEYYTQIYILKILTGTNLQKK
jgi:outer membrane protein TolC